ncbi:unnamed protein product [Discula destructiva]
MAPTVPTAPMKRKGNKRTKPAQHEDTTGHISKKTRLANKDKTEIAPSARQKIPSRHTAASPESKPQKSASSTSRAKPLTNAFDESTWTDTSAPEDEFFASSKGLSSQAESRMQPPLLSSADPCDVPFVGKEKSAAKELRRHSSSDLEVSDVSHTPLNMHNMPAEIQQMIWGNVVMTPACHTFQLTKDDLEDENQDEDEGAAGNLGPSQWTVDLWRGHKMQKWDTSAYQLLKQYHSLKNIGFETTLRRMTKSMHPLSLRITRPSGKKNQPSKPYNTTAAIDKDQDLVILEFDRAKEADSFFTWFQHTGNHPGGMAVAAVQERLRPFRKVAVYWKEVHKFCHAVTGVPFYCYCRGDRRTRHYQHKICPIELACFADLFPELEEFYIVIESKSSQQKHSTTEYRNKVAEMGFAAEVKAGISAGTSHSEGTTEMQPLARFFDAKYEYLQKLRRPRFKLWSLKTLWECITETKLVFQSRIGDEEFRQDLEARQKVSFGLLIRYELENNRMIAPTPTVPAKMTQAAKQPQKGKQPQKASQRLASRRGAL